jgi:hypothetical protein
MDCFVGSTHKRRYRVLSAGADLADQIYIP